MARYAFIAEEKTSVLYSVEAESEEEARKTFEQFWKEDDMIAGDISDSEWIEWGYRRAADFDPDVRGNSDLLRIGEGKVSLV